jgi:hypothetical protein
VVGDVEHDAEHHERRADEVQVARRRLDRALKARPKTEIGIVPTMMYQPMRASSEAAQARVAQGAQPRDRHPPQVLAEVHEDREHRPELGHRGERGARVLPAHERGTMRRCPDEEMGRNSVSPCTRPRTMAWKASMDGAGQ